MAETAWVGGMVHIRAPRLLLILTKAEFLAARQGLAPAGCLGGSARAGPA
jgi:hypothetical protein